MNNFRRVLFHILGKSLSDNEMTLKVNELGIDSVRFWEIIEILENELNVEYQIDEIVDGASNFKDLERITERKFQ